MTFNPTDRVVMSQSLRDRMVVEYRELGHAAPDLTGPGVVVGNPYAELVPPELMQAASEALGYGDVWVRWSLDPDYAAPMSSAELELWIPSCAENPRTPSGFKIGDAVQTRAEYCACERCDFTLGVVIDHNPEGVTKGLTSGHHYMVQWDDGWITFDDVEELTVAGKRHN